MKISLHADAYPEATLKWVEHVSKKIYSRFLMKLQMLTHNLTAGKWFIAVKEVLLGSRIRKRGRREETQLCESQSKIKYINSQTETERSHSNTSRNPQEAYMLINVYMYVNVCKWKREYVKATTWYSLLFKENEEVREVADLMVNFLVLNSWSY